MSMLKLVSAVIALSMAGALAAQATPGFTTAHVNHRTGPDIDFPSMGVIPEATPVDIRGCLRDESWCDVIADGNRGWVFSEYLAYNYRGRYMPLPDVGLTVARVPIVTFYAPSYWRRYYLGRPWYSERDRWVRFAPRARPGWRAPPQGPRRPGWWRSGYQNPPGMRPPPEHFGKWPR